MKIKKGDIPHVQDGWKYETYIMVYRLALMPARENCLLMRKS